MPTTAGDCAGRGFRGRWPEVALAALAAVVFLGALGSVDLWGKREQRASAEAIDTIDNHHWLVARLQGRPRLEKPPLPRWSIAALMALTGRRDAWAVRLPGAVAALGMVGLVYGLGSRLGGRSAGLSAGLVLTSMGFFVAELRQAGNDGPLAFFATLALYAAWRRLHAEGAGAAPGSARWNLVFHAALGLGMLCKGPVVVLVVAVTVVPYLACAGRLRGGLALLADGRGLALFLALSLSWPVPVLLDDPNALKVWLLEMGQKTGGAGIPHPHNARAPLAADWPWLTVPWAAVATLALAIPFRRARGGPRGPGPGAWFPWWWSAGNLAMFACWSVAKPSYFLPCLPGAALLCGLEWVRLTRSARTDLPGAALARGVLQAHWVALFVAALVAPVVAFRLAPEFSGWVAACALALALAVPASALAWRRGADALALVPLVGAAALAVVVGYGVLAPTEDARRGHRAFAAALDRALPADARTVMFYREIDEGLWFHVRGRDLVAVPGTRPAYNDTYATVEAMRTRRYERDPAKRADASLRVLLSWLRRPRPDRPTSYVLIRDTYYDLFAPALSGLVEPVYRERGVKRNALVLLRVAGDADRVTR